MSEHFAVMMVMFIALATGIGWALGDTLASRESRRKGRR